MDGDRYRCNNIHLMHSRKRKEEEKIINHNNTLYTVQKITKNEEKNEKQWKQKRKRKANKHRLQLIQNSR